MEKHIAQIHPLCLNLKNHKNHYSLHINIYTYIKNNPYFCVVNNDV